MRNDKVLIYLNSFDESTKLINDEFERTNATDKKEKRRHDLSLSTQNQNGKVISPNDTYAISVEENIVNWMNTEIAEICGQLKDKNYVIVTAENIGNYNSSDFRYVLRYRYLIPKGDLLETEMFFYFHDRKENMDLLNLDSIDVKTFHPFFFYTADKWYPFYGVMKLTKVKKEWEKCLKSL